MKALVERYREKGLVVLGLNDEPEPEKVAKFVRSKGVNYPVLLGMNAVFKAYGYGAYPTNVLVDREGIVRDRQVGFSEEALPAAIEALLEGKPVPAPARAGR